jgi:invasion protein IalB
MYAKTATLSCLLAIAAVVPAVAQQPAAKQIGQHNAWGTYSATTDDSGKVCFVLTVPTEKQPASLDHGDRMFFLVSQKPGQNVSYEPQFMASYNFKDDSKVTVSVGDKSFSMFTRGNSAWLENAAEDTQLVAAMKAGADMKVQAVSGRGNPTNYTFSLRGVSAALQSISSCK